MKEVEGLFKERLNDLLEIVKTETNYKDANRMIWKMKLMVVGPKVGPAESVCINDPTTGELQCSKSVNFEQDLMFLFYFNTFLKE